MHGHKRRFLVALCALNHVVRSEGYSPEEILYRYQSHTLLPGTTTDANFEKGMKKREDKHKKMRYKIRKLKDRPGFNIRDQGTIREEFRPSDKMDSSM